jgi:hypothetical protein
MNEPKSFTVPKGTVMKAVLEAHRRNVEMAKGKPAIGPDAFESLPPDIQDLWVYMMGGAIAAALDDMMQVPKL